MSKKFFGKRSIAVISALAILVSLVAMLAGLSLTSSAAYTPTRTVSITGNSSNTGAKMGIINSANVIGSNVTYTVKGYYKVEGFTGVTGQVAYGFICHGTGYSTPKYAIYGNNDWTPFEFTGVTSGLEANSAQWIMFGFVNAYGTISVADVTMTNSSGSQIYSMASDTALTNGTSSNVVNRQLGMWYFTAPTVTVAAGSGSSSGGSTSSSLSLSASATTVATEEKITLTATGGATSIVISRVDGQWNNTYSGSSISLGFGWAGEYTAYATDGTNKSNSVNFTVGSSAPAETKPTSATIGADKSVYKIGDTVTFSMVGDGNTNTLWIYKPDSTSEYFQNAGSTYTYIPTVAGQYEALMETWNGAGSFCSEKIKFRVVDPNAPVTTPSTTQTTTTQSTTTQPTTQSTTTTQTTTTQPTTPPTTISTTAPTTVSTTAPTTVSTQGNPCAKGHKYQNGYCIYCAKKDPNWHPCISGHSFQNGFCIYCLAEDPTYDPCAGGHTYQDGWCIYCLAEDPIGCARGEHNYQNGSCVDCYAADPNVVDPCANGHDLDSNGSCKNCNYFDPDFDPNATEPTQPADKDTSKNSSNGSNDSFWLWFWIILALFVVFIIMAVMLIIKKNHSSDDTPAAE